MQFETSETGFTPGPMEASGFSIVRPGRFIRERTVVARVACTYCADTIGDENWREACERSGIGEAEAYRLAAFFAAAPAMFQALRRIVDIEDERSAGDDSPETLATLYRAIEDARVALALAQGKPARDPNCDTALDRDARNQDALHNRPEEL